MTDRVGPDNVFVPIHFAESAVNRLTDEEHLDPAAATPEFKVSAVQLRAADPEAEPTMASAETTMGDD